MAYATSLFRSLSSARIIFLLSTACRQREHDILSYTWSGVSASAELLPGLRILGMGVAGWKIPL